MTHCSANVFADPRVRFKVRLRFVYVLNSCVLVKLIHFIGLVGNKMSNYECWWHVDARSRVVSRLDLHQVFLTIPASDRDVHPLRSTQYGRHFTDDIFYYHNSSDWRGIAGGWSGLCICLKTLDGFHLFEILWHYLICSCATQSYLPIMGLVMCQILRPNNEELTSFIKIESESD